MNSLGNNKKYNEQREYHKEKLKIAAEERRLNSEREAEDRRLNAEREAEKR